MNAENVKISCTLTGDSAIDFERLSVMFKVQGLASTRQEQQAMMIRASLLALDASTRKCSEATGKRYPRLEEVLDWNGCSVKDIQKLLLGSPVAGVDAVKSAIAREAKRKK